jgi:hypothetical protein
MASCRESAKLKLPEWYVSSLMMDRALDASNPMGRHLNDPSTGREP